MPSAREIDKACRLGFFVYIGNRQKVWGAVTEHHQHGKATKGKVWISVVGRGWQEVEERAVVITDEPWRRTETSNAEEGETTMAGRGRPKGSKNKAAKGLGFVRQVASRKPRKRGAQANNGNLELPGVDVDARRIPAIEKAEEHRQQCSAAISSAQEDYDEALKKVVETMHSNGFTLEKNPVYTRHPWGSVVLQATGEVKEKVKFVKAAAKKKADQNGDGDED